MNYFLKNKITNASSKGFTLVEMAIVTAIFGLLTAVVVFKYGDFTSNLLVTNMAYEIALTTRQAQIFGLGVRGYAEGEERNFSYPYGVFFNLQDGSTGAPEDVWETKKFSFFVDNKNEDYEPGYGQCNTALGNGDCICTSGDECIEQLTLQRNIKITEIRVSAGVDVCEADKVNKLAVTFQRPSPEARIEWQDNDGGSGYEFAQLKVEAKGSGINPAYVLIRKNGQISVSGNSLCEIINNG